MTENISTLYANQQVLLPPPGCTAHLSKRKKFVNEYIANPVSCDIVSIRVQAHAFMVYLKNFPTGNPMGARYRLNFLRSGD